MLNASCFQIGSLNLEKVAPYPLLILQGSVDNLVLYSNADIFVLSIYHLTSFLNWLFRLNQGSMIINAIIFDVSKFTIYPFLQV